MLNAILKCIVLFLSGHLLLRWGLDLRDHPGAAGVESLAKAASLTPKDDIAAHIITQIHLITGLSVELSARMSSTLAGMMGVIGMVLAGGAGMGKRGALTSGVLAALWAMTHTYALLTGKDALGHGFAALGVGLCWWGFRKEMGLSLTIGATLLPLAVGLNESALPSVALAAMGAAFCKRWANKIWLWTPVIAYCAFWSWAWFWPEQSTRLDTDSPFNWDGLTHGLSRLMEFRSRGIPEGKFIQIGLLGLLFLVMVKRAKKRLLLIWIGSALVVLATAHYLGARCRPRYIGTSAFGILAALGWGIVVLEKQMRNAKRWLLPLAASLLCIDTWAFFDAWSNKRETMIGSRPMALPRAPFPWRVQYRDMPELTHRDLSLTGGASLAERVQSGRDIATPRLRDERHRALAAYAAIAGQRHVVLDPGACCAGSPVNLRCAKNTISMLADAGIDLMIPTEIEGVERIYKHEQKWIDSLREAADSIERTDHWLIQVHNGDGTLLPCQTKAPFRSEK